MSLDVFPFLKSDLFAKIVCTDESVRQIVKVTGVGVRVQKTHNTSRCYICY